MNNKFIVRVKDIMHQNYLMVDGLTNAQEAINQMRDKNTPILVVQKRHDDDEYGLVLPVDIAQKILATDRSCERVSIYEIMTKPVLCIQENMNIKYCARLLGRFNLDHAPVVNKDNQIIGMVDYTSLVLKSMANNDQA